MAYIVHFLEISKLQKKFSYCDNMENKIILFECPKLFINNER